VKTTHHRARRAMSAHERRKWSADLAEQTRETLERFLASLAAHDVPAIESMLADGVRSMSDGGGEFSAARNVIVGRERVLRFLVGLASKYGAHIATEMRTLNGLPAVVIDVPRSSARFAPRFVLRIDLGADGRIAEVHAILATRKLTAVAR
jgi:RNA polymerase sigma-70 factor (ECF subfamily)